jgi:hypothetical protein
MLASLRRMKLPTQNAGWFIAGGSVCLMVVFASLGRTTDPDVFWHLAVAREVLATHSTLPRDLFSFSFAGAPWPHKDFLAELVLYGLFRALGYAGFALFKGACAIGLVAALVCAAPRAGRTALGLTLVGGLTLTSFWFLEQPNAFSIVLFGVVLSLVERARRAGAETTRAALLRALLPLIAVTWAWTWLHRFALIGHALLALFALECWVARATLPGWTRRVVGPAVSRRFARTATAVAVASPVLALANPTGAAAFLSVRTMATHAELRQEFFEWKQPSLAEVFDVFPVACVATLVAAGCVAFAMFGAGRFGFETRIRGWHGAVVAAAAGMTLWSIRWAPFMAVAALLVIAVALGDLFASPAWRRGVRQPLLVPVLALCAGTAFFLRLREQQGSADLTLGEDPSFFPRGAVDFAREHGLAGPVANAFDFGGYLIYWAWPETQVLVDGRNETVYPAHFVVTALRAERDPDAFRDLRAAHRATWALGTNFPGKEGFAFLAQDPRWSLVYWSETAAIYVLRAAHPELEALRYRFIDPRDLEGSIRRALMGEERWEGRPPSLEAVRGEIERMLVDSPDSVRATGLLALVLSMLGPLYAHERDVALERLERLGAGDLWALRLVSRIRAAVSASTPRPR